MPKKAERQETLPAARLLHEALLPRGLVIVEQVLNVF